MKLMSVGVMLLPMVINAQDCDSGSGGSSASWNPGVGTADCKAVWGKLSPCDWTPDDYLVVRKSARNLAVCKGGANVNNFRVGLGFNPVGDKQQQGDGRTPEGTFYVSQTNPGSKYYKAFVLSYPDKQAADKGYAAGLIGAGTRSQIYAAQNSCGAPPSGTALGGLVEVHGHGGSSDWTAGCIAIDDVQMDYLWARIGKRDTVVVLP